MTQQSIITTPANSGQGDSPKAAFDKCNANFTDVYTQVGAVAAIVAASGSVSGSIGSPGLTLTQLQTLNNLNGNTHWFQTASLGAASIPAGTSDTNGSSGSFSVVNSPAYTAQAMNPSAGSVAQAVLATIMKTSTSANNTFYLYSTAAQPGNNLQLFRQVSAGPIAGFSMTAYLYVATAAAGMNGFIGVINSAIGGGANPSTQLNMVGFAKDATDTDLQFMYNNGSGTATKIDTGINFASMVNHLFRFTISCDGTGNVAASCTDLEPTGNLGSFSTSVLAATAKLPVANTAVMPFIECSTAASGVAVGYGFHSLFVTTGLMV